MEKSGFKRKVGKRLLAAALAGAMILLCACGNNGGNAMYKEYKGSRALVTAALAESAGQAGYMPYGEEDFLYSDGFSEDNERMMDAQLKLFKALAKSDENSMISPISIIYALGMVENGAGGRTLEELEAFFGIDKEAMTEWLAAWGRNFTGREDVKVNLANSLWFRDEGTGSGKDFEPDEDYLKVLAGRLMAQAYASAFDQGTVEAINSWCKDNTFGMIDKIIDGIDKSEVAILLNAIAFEGKWVKEYEDESVTDDKFYRADGKAEDAKLMYSKESKYLEDELATGFRKSYEGLYSYVAILPKDGVSVAQYLEKLDGERFLAFLDSAKPAAVHSFLPKYKSEYSREDVKDVLSELGLNTLFEPSKANLTGMGKSSSGNLYVGDVIHKTFIDVDEKGTKAAAVTKIGVKNMALAPEEMQEYTVRLDRPFLYAIVDDVTGTPVFIGTVTSVADGGGGE